MKEMKARTLISSLLSASLIMAAAACSDDDAPKTSPYEWGNQGSVKTCDHILFNADGSENENGTVIGNGDQEFVFTGNQTLKKGVYELKGWVYVGAGATLTIEPGTVIRGDKETQASLIVEPGGKLYAEGTATEPIVFTSEQAKGQRKPGDWGGLIICGKARNNQGVLGQQIEGGPRTKHGGTDDNDNSGVLRYVRVEFAGYPFQKDKEINGITFGSVGSGTTVDHVQVSYSNDDSYEWFGGSVNCRYLVAYNGWDDEFDTDNGFSGKVQFCLSIRDPRIADTSQSNGFESDNCADGSLVEPFTSAVFSNVTFIGPLGRDANFSNDASYINGGSYNPNNGSALGKFQAAMQIRRSSRLNCFNSVAIGYPIGLIIDGEKGNTVESAKNGQIGLQNVWFAGMGITGSDANKVYDDVLYDARNKAVIDANQESYSSTFFKAQSGNRVMPNIADLLLSDPRHIGVNYLPTASSPLLNAASFSNPLLASWFEQVSYIGAFGSSDNWLDGWTNFDPQNTDY
mgnify:CR=1 FL=1